MTERQFRIGEAAQELGIEPHVIRYWEREFGLKPLRSKSGQRVYTERQLERLREIHRLLKVELFTIAGAKRRLRKHG